MMPIISAAGSHDQTKQWVLRRPLSASPKLFLGVLGSLALLCLLIASVWAWFGATWVLVFAGADVVALAAAAVWTVRHATDSECLELNASELNVTRTVAGRVEQWCLPRFYVRLSLEVTAKNPQGARFGVFARPRLCLRANKQSIQLGGFSSEQSLRRVEYELKVALRG